MESVLIRCNDNDFQNESKLVMVLEDFATGFETSIKILSIVNTIPIYFQITILKGIKNFKN